MVSELYKCSNIHSEGEEAFIVSHLKDEEKEQYEYIRSQIVIATARGKRLKSFMDRVLNVTAQSNPGIPKEYAEHLMRDMDQNFRRCFW